MFKKKFNHDDLSHYQPVTNLNQLVTVDFLNKKHKNLMPEYISELLINNMIDDEEEREQRKYEILQRKKEQDEKLINEYLERFNEN